MKKIAFLMALILTVGALAACGESSDTTTAANKGDSTSAPAGTTQGNDPAGTDPAAPADPGTQTTPQQPSQTTESGGDTQLTEPGAALSYPAEDVIALPGGKSGDLDLEGYDAAGVWDIIDGKLTSAGEHSMFIVTNDRMSAGRLTTTFTSNGDSAENDNGLVFGMEDMTEEEAYWFWEDPYYAPRYYFLFVSDHNTLYLAKVAYNGQAWTELGQSQVIIGYAHGGTVTVSVEFDGKGTINCYANGELVLEYQDSDPITGDRYGIRCEVFDVVYDGLIAEHAED